MWLRGRVATWLHGYAATRLRVLDICLARSCVVAISRSILEWPGILQLSPQSIMEL